MTEMTPKLKKRLAVLGAAGGIVPWLDAPRQHDRLKELGLVVEGTTGDQQYAVLVEMTEEESDGEECA